MSVLSVGGASLKKKAVIGALHFSKLGDILPPGGCPRDEQDRLPPPAGAGVCLPYCDDSIFTLRSTTHIRSPPSVDRRSGGARYAARLAPQPVLPTAAHERPRWWSQTQALNKKSQLRRTAGADATRHSFRLLSSRERT